MQGEVAERHTQEQRGPASESAEGQVLQDLCDCGKGANQSRSVSKTGPFSIADIFQVGGRAPCIICIYFVAFPFATI